MRQLEVDQRGENAVMVQELRRIPGDERGPGAIAGPVTPEPTPEKLDHRIGWPTGGEVVRFEPRDRAAPDDLVGRRGNVEPTCSEGDRVQPVHARHVVDALEHEAAPRRVVGRARQALLAGHAIHHDRFGETEVDQAIDVRHRESLSLEQVVHDHLVAQGVGRREVGPTRAAHVQLDQASFAQDIDEPPEPPPRQAPHRDDVAPELGLDPLDEPLRPRRCRVQPSTCL